MRGYPEKFTQNHTLPQTAEPAVHDDLSDSDYEDEAVEQQSSVRFFNQKGEIPVWDNGNKPYDQTSTSSNSSSIDTDCNDEEQPPSSVNFTSKKGNIVWSSEKANRSSGEKCAINIIDQTPGITRYAASRISDILSAFELFITPKLFNIILKMTNIEANRVLGSGDIISLKNLRAFYGLRLLAGVYNLMESLLGIWDKDLAACDAEKVISGMLKFTLGVKMNLQNVGKRTVIIYETVHDDLSDSDYEDEAVEQQSSGPDSSTRKGNTDEQLVRFRGKCPFRHYIPSKPDRYGIKIWAACDAENSYLWNAEGYTGRKDESAERGQVHDDLSDSDYEDEAVEQQSSGPDSSTRKGNTDEQLVRFRGKCPFRHYIPSKPDRYGIKIWAACDAENSYLWNAEGYTGRKDESAERGQVQPNGGARDTFKRRIFIHELGLALVQPVLSSRVSLPRTPNAHRVAEAARPSIAYNNSQSQERTAK
ncbi:uncharacterized protein [Palaemon carinicauda]|uniref:uncharacterized protein n=1 Tax=Palaemon carinicauda TaxID=392227 RepID=UPI0035B57281